MFRIQVNKTEITVYESEPMTSGSIGVYQARFEFSDHWDGFSKTAIFYTDKSESYVTVQLDKDDACTIPEEVLVEAGSEVFVGVCGTLGLTKTLPTTAVSLGKLKRGICVTT